MDVKSQLCFLTPKQLRSEAPLFIFLPGMDGTGQLLQTQTAGLEAAFDVRCLAIPPDDLQDWSSLTEETLTLVRTEIAKSEVPRTVYLGGESFGACLAMKMMVQAPELFDRVVLVNPASSFNRRWFVHWGSHLSDLLPEPIYKVASIGFLPLLASLGRMSGQDRHELVTITQTIPQKTSAWRMSLLREFHLPDEVLQQVKQPVLIVTSGSDWLLPSMEEAHRLFNLFPQAQITVLPHSGHACLLEAETNLYEILRRENFLTLNSERSLSMTSV